MLIENIGTLAKGDPTCAMRKPSFVFPKLGAGVCLFLRMSFHGGPGVCLCYPHALQNGIGGGGISTPGIPFGVNHFPFGEEKWNCGTPHPPPP